MRQEDYKYYIRYEDDKIAREVPVDEYRRVIKGVLFIHDCPDIFSGIISSNEGVGIDALNGARVEGFIAKEEDDFKRYKHGINGVTLKDSGKSC